MSKALYEEFHEDTIPLTRIPRETDFVMMNHLPVYKKYLRRDQEVLDIGCGGGAFSLFAAGLGASVKGVDISERAIAQNVRSATNLRLNNVVFEAADFMKYDDQGRYDVVMMTEVLEHLPDDVGALAKVHSFLKQGGCLLLSVPSENAPLHRRYLQKYGRDPFDERVGHLRRYDAARIEKLVNQAGFDIREIKLCEGLLRNWLFNDPVGRHFLRFSRSIVKHAVSLADNRLVVPLWGESDIILAARKV